MMDYCRYEDAFDAFKQLVLLRDEYNEGWIPDWTDCTVKKYTIFVSCDDIDKSEFFTRSHVLAFRTEEIRDKFLKDNEELINAAKPLL